MTCVGGHLLISVIRTTNGQDLRGLEGFLGRRITKTQNDESTKKRSRFENRLSEFVFSSARAFVIDWVRVAGIPALGHPYAFSGPGFVGP